MQIQQPEVKNFKIVYSEKVDPAASTSYTATSSSARLNVTLVVPSNPSTPKGSPASSSAVIAHNAG
jgi:hypothetical protein